MLREETGGTRRAAHDVVHGGPRDERPAARRDPGRHGRRTVVRLRHHGAGVHARRRPLAVLRHRGAHARARPEPPGRDHGRLGACRRPHPLLRRRRATSPASRAVLERWPRAELVEDNAHGLFGRYRGRPLGSFGRFSTLSFHETKNFICGEGGALVVNREDDVRRAHVVYHKGTNRREFLLGEVDKYTWQDIGSSFGLADVLAAYLYAQLEERDKILTKRRAAFDRYLSMLEPEAERHGYPLPGRPAGSRAGVPHVLRAAARRRDPRPGARGHARPGRARRRSTTCRCTALPAVAASPPGTSPAPSASASAPGCCACPSTPTSPTPRPSEVGRGLPRCARRG